MVGITQSPPSLHRGASNPSYLLLALLDGLAVVSIGYATVVLTGTGEFPGRYLVMLLILLGAMGFFYDRFAVYQPHSGFARHVVTLAKAWVFSFALLLALGFVTKETEAFSRVALGTIFVGGLTAQMLIHTGFRLVHGYLKTPASARKALIVGTGELANNIFSRIHNNPWVMQSVVGAVTLNGDNIDATPAARNLAVLGSIDDTLDLVDRYGIKTVYLAVPLDASPAIEPLYFRLLDRNVDVHWAPNIFSLPLINHSIGDLGGIPILTLSETPLVGTRRLVKDAEDRILSFLILLLASPLMLLTAIAIKLESEGPVFFRQPRTGWDGKVFHIWKFRSMRVHQEPEGVVKQATRDDPRVTRVGRFIRRTSIDELPQLFNVLVGDMSLVGPRPHAVQHNQEYAGKITAYLARHRIKPGITGLAQVRGFRGETKDLEQMAKRVEFDIEYINNWSVWLDLMILVRTGFTLFSKNAY